MNIRTISISDIDLDLEWNTRNPADVAASSGAQAESAGLEGLMANLRAVGQTTPVDVRSTIAPFYRDVGSKPYSLVTGFRRITALESIYAGGASVPGMPIGHILAIDHGSLSEREAFLLNARENANRETLSPPDTCMLIKRGIEYGLSTESLAVQLGFTAQIVASYRRVTELPTEILTHWRSGGNFQGKTTQKRLGVAEMIAITRAFDPIKAYEEALGQRASRERRGSRHEKARARAVASAVQLAHLVKRGMFTMPSRIEWLQYIDVVASVEGRTRISEAETLARAAKQAFESAMAAPNGSERQSAAVDDAYEDDSSCD